MFETIDKNSILNQLPLFSELSKSERELIAQKAYFSESKKDQIIYYEGNPPDSFYYLITGRVKIFTKDTEGRENILEYLHRGKYFGIISLLTREPHSVTAQAINDSIILKIEKKDFDFLLKKIPKLAIDLSLTLSRRLKRKDIHPKQIFESTIISIYSLRRGLGKTTYAINLALGLKKETRKNVILVELSTGEFCIFKYLWMPQDLGFVELQNFSFDYQNLQNSIIRNRLLEIDILNIKYKDPSSKISAILSLLTNDYHFIIVDLPSHYDRTILETLNQSDSVHLISSPKIEGLKETDKILSEIKQKIRYKESKIKIIISDFLEGITSSERIKQNIYPVRNSGDLVYSKDMVKNYLFLAKGCVQSCDISNGVYATLPKLDVQEKAKAILEYPETEYARTIRRISRQTADILVGLALGVGAAYGLAHIGVLKVIEEENIPIDVISGSSIGALIGSLWAIGKNSKEIEDIFKSEFGQPKNVFKLLDFGFPRSGFIKGVKIKRLLEKYLENKTFYDIKLPLKILACDVKRKCTEIIDKGSLLDAVMASCAIPGIFRPVRYKEELLLDGGILNPLPTEVLVKMGVKKIIAVNVTPSKEDILEKIREKSFSLQIPKIKDIFKTNIFDMIFSSIELMQAEIEKSQATLADIVLHPNLSGLNWLEFHRVSEFVEKSEITARENLEEIKRIVYE